MGLAGLGDDLRLLRAHNAVRREHPELGVIGVMPVAKVENCGPPGHLPLQKALHVGDDSAGAGAAGPQGAHAGPQGGNGSTAESGGDGEDVIDADYEVVDEEKK